MVVELGQALGAGALVPGRRFLPDILLSALCKIPGAGGKTLPACKCQRVSGWVYRMRYCTQHGMPGVLPKICGKDGARMSDTRLRPCPFCGGEAKIVKTSSAIWTKCVDCNASSGCRPTEKEVVEAWNRRTREQDE